MNGILLIDKPSDWTSSDVVAKLRLATEELYKLEKSRDAAKGNA